jgi:hypothetical protein
VSEDPTADGTPYTDPDAAFPEEAEAADAEEGNPFGMTLRDEDPDHPEPELVLVCPICGLPACKHNLPYVEKA